ncbi:cytochrome c biogenesis protein CcdA [Allocatelliglobosispora scoriae]|uniref:Cytochrome c biogenesis protein CcdA n=1 Tax=Allocatelliglobosispora scoriae TaxID=643052 RepID=A0A841BSF4_9ACTN|nr:cytochrome c biogenesis protein CcdA [Allocatelliglobosispora scoriae]MBB5869843.1 cytochrome c biogenesis protein CcdA [Allocatelliglobosispora scoriae]
MPSDPSYPMAVAAGALATVNPCGFALLAAYASLVVLGDDATARPAPLTAVARALTMTTAMTLGFVTAFGAFALLAEPVATWIAERLPWLTIGTGVVLVLLGAWVISGRDLPSPAPRRRHAPPLRGRFGPMYAFGLTYAIASVSCAVNPFLGMVRDRPAVTGFGLFLAYAAGISLVAATISVGVGLIRHSTVPLVRRLAPTLFRAAGVMLIVPGGYVAWFGWYEIRVGGGTVADPVINLGTAAQSWLATGIDTLGPLALVATCTLMISIALAAHHLRRAT